MYFSIDPKGLEHNRFGKWEVPKASNFFNRERESEGDD